MVSIIMPALNEADVIARGLRAALEQEGAPEILVVDGGSRDATVEVAKRMRARVLETELSQRARQMNVGAAEAGGAVLLFLHADTVLRPGAVRAIEQAFENPRVVGGAFERIFEMNSLFLTVAGRLTRLRNRVIGWHLGDQAIFARRTVFDELGGFKPCDRFEDLDFSRRLGRFGRVVTLTPAVLTSARRFERRGAAGQTMRDFLLTLMYLSGSPNAVRRDRVKPAKVASRNAPNRST